MMNYAIVGGGRLARHFSHYFQLLEIPHTRWARDARSRFNTFESPDAEQRLRETVGKADRVLLLVSDNVIGTLLKQYPFLHEKQLLHCSGALSFPGIAGAHPLMTFADDLYGLETYRSVPFVVEAGHSFEDLFPGLPNPHFAINVEDKARYHAMCVMAGNFSQVLWKGISGRFEQQFDLPAGSLHPYLSRVAGNFIEVSGAALTGPLIRNDQQTIEKNIQSLDGDPLQDLYRAFVRFYQSDPGQTQIEQAKMEQVS
jgi:2-dehydropantoate 2-reductase